MEVSVVQAGLEFLASSNPPALASQNAGITGVSHSAQPIILLFSENYIFILEKSMHKQCTMAWVFSEIPARWVRTLWFEPWSLYLRVVQTEAHRPLGFQNRRRRWKSGKPALC